MQDSSSFLEEAQAVKVVAFMEIVPLSDRFQQIALTEEQCKKLRNAISTIIYGKEAGPADGESFDVVTNEKIEVLLTDVREYYGEDYFKEESDKKN